MATGVPPSSLSKIRRPSASGPARRWYTGAQFRPLLHTVDHKARELGADTLDRHLFLAVPVRYRVGHAEYAEHCQPRIEIGMKLAAPHPFLENVLKNSLQSARPFSDPPAAFTRQVLTLVQEDPDKITAVGHRREVRFDEARELVGGGALSRCNRLGDLEVSGHALETNEFERPLLGGKVIVEARLPNAEHVGDVLGCRTMEAALREDARSGLDNLGCPPPWAWPQAPCRERHDGHDLYFLRTGPIRLRCCLVSRRQAKF